MSQNQLVSVPFNGEIVIAALVDGKPYVPMKPICNNLGLDWKSQHSRIQRNQVMSQGIRVIRTPSNGGEQEMLCLPLSMLNGWLFGVDVNRVREEIRPKLISYQRECFDVLWQYWNDGLAINPRALHSVNPGDVLTKEEADTLRQMVEGMAKKLSADTKVQGKFILQAWSKLKSHFKVSYREIPRQELTEAISIISRHTVEWELVDEAPQQPQAAPQPTAFTQALAAARENALSYMNGYRQAVQSGQPGPRMDDIPGALLEGIVAEALMSSRFLAGFDHRTGQMHVQLVPQDASVFSFQSGDFGQAISAIPTRRLPELQDALSRRVARHLGTLAH